MKLSEIHPDDVQLVSAPGAPDGGLKLSNVHPNDIKPVTPMSDIDSGSDLEDLARGAAQGVTLGGADELEGAVKAGSDINIGDLLTQPSSEIDRLKKLYHQYQQTSQKDYESSQKRSPYLYGAGQIAGAIAPAILTAGTGAAVEGAGLAAQAPSLAARLGGAALKGSAMGAVAGGLGSEGSLVGGSDSDSQKLLNDVGTGAGAGAVLGGAAQAAGELGGKVVSGVKKYFNGLQEEKPLIQQLNTSYQLGKEGTDLAKRSDVLDLAQKNMQNKQDIVSRIQSADNMLGQQVGKTIQDASEQGKTILIPSTLKQDAASIAEFFNTNASFNIDRKSAELFKHIMSNDEIDPLEAIQVKKQMQELLSRIDQSKDPLSTLTAEHINSFSKDLNKIINDQIPGYRDAVARQSNFRSNVPSTIINQGVPEQYAGNSYGSSSDKTAALFKGVDSNLVSGSELPGSATQEAKNTLSALQNNIQGIESQGNEDILDKLGGTGSDFLNKIRDSSNLSAIMHQASGVNPQEGAQTLLKGVALGSTTGRGKLLNVANKIGGFSNKIPSVASANVFDLPNQSLTALANHLALSEDPTINTLAKSVLKGLESGNTATKNAGLFALLQNPNARATIYNMVPNTNPENQKNQ